MYPPSCPCLQLVLSVAGAFKPLPFLLTLALWEFFVSCSLYNCRCFKLHHPPFFPLKNGWWSILPLRQRWGSLTEWRTCPRVLHHLFQYTTQEHCKEFLKTLWSFLSSKSSLQPVGLSWADNETNAMKKKKILNGFSLSHCISLSNKNTQILINDKEKLVYFEKKRKRLFAAVAVLDLLDQLC